MEQEITSGTRMLNMVLKVTVVILVGILASVAVAAILKLVGIL